LNVLDLFSGGAGGWSLGLHRAGFRTVAAAEADPWRRAIFGLTWGVPVCDDVRNLNAKWFRENTGLDRPFLVCGSPPCKEYSSANHRGGGLDADDLFLEAVRIVAELGPDWVAFENSPRVRTRGYDRIADALEAIGFACWPNVVGLANAGAAHRRGRLWLVALNTNGDWQSRVRVDGQVARGLGQLHSDDGGAAWGEEGRGRAGRWWERCQEDGIRISGDRDAIGLRIEHGRRIGPDGEVAPISLDPSAILGPVGSPVLGSHIREYDGLPAGLAELCRAAYGDAVGPIIPELIGRAIMSLSGLSIQEPSRRE
jgi:DNA (cytosine-5)-methyltransferase 1